MQHGNILSLIDNLNILHMSANPPPPSVVVKIQRAYSLLCLQSRSYSYIALECLIVLLLSTFMFSFILVVVVVFTDDERPNSWALGRFHVHICEARVFTADAYLVGPFFWNGHSWPWPVSSRDRSFGPNRSCPRKQDSSCKTCNSNCSTTRKRGLV